MRSINRLTAVSVAKAKLKGLYSDGAGLYLRVTTSGTRHWLFRYTRRGATRDMGLGSVRDVSLAKARDLAAEARRKLTDGHDPLKLRVQAKTKAGGAESATFEQCAKQLIAAHESGWRNAKHRAQWLSTLKGYVYPVIGKLPIGEIDTGDVLRVLEPIWHEKPETASRIRGRIEAVLNWAKARGLRDGLNPAQWRGHLDQLLPAKTKVRRVRHHPALPYSELPLFMVALRSNTSISARALEFVILTAARTGEALGARWDEFDLDSGMWTVPAERMKAGREHRVPLSDPAVAIIRGMTEIRRGEFVFSGVRSGRALSDMSLLMLLRDLRPGVTTHGFRSTFKDWCADCTHVPNYVSEAALAHAVADRVEAAYRRTDLLEKRRELLAHWASYCAYGSVDPLASGPERFSRRRSFMRATPSG